LAPDIGGKGCNRIADAADWLAFGHLLDNWGPLLQGADQRGVIYAHSEGDELVLGPEVLNELQLAASEYLDRQTGKIAEDPDEIKPLLEGWPEIAWAERSHYPQHAAEEFFDHAHLPNKFLDFNAEALAILRPRIIAPDTLQWEVNFQNLFGPGGKLYCGPLHRFY